jgi:hypothetical protein
MTAAAVLLTQTVLELDNMTSSIAPHAIQISKALVVSAKQLLESSQIRDYGICVAMAQACGHTLMARLSGIEGDLDGCTTEVDVALGILQTLFSSPEYPTKGFGLGKLTAYSLFLRGKAMFAQGLMDAAEVAFQAALDSDSAAHRGSASTFPSALRNNDAVMAFLVDKVSSRWDPKQARNGVSVIGSRKAIKSADDRAEVRTQPAIHLGHCYSNTNPLTSRTEPPDLNIDLDATDPRAR